MSQFATKDELEELKVEMQVLRSLLSKDEIINQKMLEATFHSRVKHFTTSQSANLIGVLTGLFIAVVFAVSYVVKGEYSLWFTIVTVLWGLLCAGISFRRYRLRTREVLLSTPLTESVSQILRWKKLFQTDGLLIALGIMVWIPCLLFEIWGDLSHNLEHAIAVCLLLFICIGSQLDYYRRTNQSIDELLNQIRELH